MTRLLTKDEIEVKVKKVTPTGILLLLYKTARTDMDILDETYGAENWQSDYKEIKGNLYAGIGVKDKDSGNWVWKWDCGIESRADGDGNEKKGEASDAFKRAGFKWGIGRELYTAPFIWVSSDVVPTEGTKLKDPYEQFFVSRIEYKNNEISKLTICGKHNREVWSNSREQQPKENPQNNKNSDIAQNTPKYPTAGQFKAMLSFCDTEDEIRIKLNEQRDNPQLYELVKLATERKEEINKKNRQAEIGAAIDELQKQVEAQ